MYIRFFSLSADGLKEIIFILKIMTDKADKSDVPRNTKGGRNWLLTINNYTEDDVKTLESLKPKLNKYSWQEEIGKSGTVHLQAGLAFKSERTLNGLKKLLPTAHIEKAKNIWAVINYCKKKDTATGKNQDSSDNADSRLIVATDDPMEGLELHDWQEDLIKIIDQPPDNRTIHWWWEPIGGVGKTTFIKHLVMYRKDILYISGSAKDIMYGITKFVIDNKRGPKVVFMNIPRSVEHVSYNGLEQVKDGIFYNTKYKSGMVVYDCPHVFVMANEKPLMARMSLDRWDIRNIGEDIESDHEESSGYF